MSSSFNEGSMGLDAYRAGAFGLRRRSSLLSHKDSEEDYESSIVVEDLSSPDSSEYLIFHSTSKVLLRLT